MGHLEDNIDYGLRIKLLAKHAEPITAPIIADALEALAISRVRFPQPNYVALKVAEEAGEVVKASVHYAEKRETWENVEKEVVQMIAMGLRLLVEGDLKNGIIPPALSNKETEAGS